MRLRTLLVAGLLGLAMAMPSFAEETAVTTPTTKSIASKATDPVSKHMEEKAGFPVNINTADAQTIANALTGIGKKRAEAIVAYRTKNGPFKSVDDLSNIKGISKKVLEKNSGKILLN